MARTFDPTMTFPFIKFCVMLLLGTRCYANGTDAVCSKHRSKLARNVLQAVCRPRCALNTHQSPRFQYVFPHMQKSGVPTLQSCPFHPDNDVYVLLHCCVQHTTQHRLAMHEQHKEPLRHDHWRCGFCGKAFQTETHLEHHMAHYHADKVAALMIMYATVVSTTAWRRCCLQPGRVCQTTATSCIVSTFGRGGLDSGRHPTAACRVMLRTHSRSMASAWCGDGGDGGEICSVYTRAHHSKWRRSALAV